MNDLTRDSDRLLSDSRKLLVENRSGGRHRRVTAIGRESAQVRNRHRLKKLRNIALVWSIAADGYADYMAFYPGDAYVDWWSIDIFTPAELRQRTTHAFIAAAAERSYPVLLETATPMSKTPKSGDDLWRMWFTPLFELLRQQRNIKALTYRDWADFSRLGDGVAVERFRLELSDPTYQQATELSELRWFLEWE